MCRVNVLEPSIGLTGTEINTSAYLGDSWAISMSDGECAIGMDGVFLGFIQNNLLIPPYVEVAFVEVVSTAIVTIRSVTVINTIPIVSRISLTGTMAYTSVTILDQLKASQFIQLSNFFKDEATTVGAGDLILNTQTGYKESYKLEASWDAPNYTISDLLPFQIEIRKNGGPWYFAASKAVEARTTFLIQDITVEIPGIVFIRSGATASGYVGPGFYDLRIKTAMITGSYSYTIISVRYPSLYDGLFIDMVNAGNPVFVSQTVPVTANLYNIYPPIATKVGFPGYAIPALLWTEDGPGSVISTGLQTANFTSGASPYIDEVSALLDPINKESLITVSIDGYPGQSDQRTVRPLPAELSDTSTYSVTGIQLIGPNNELNAITVSTSASVTIGSVIQGTGTFPSSLNLVWSILSGSGTISREFYAVGRPGEQLTIIPASGTTQVKALCSNGVFGIFSVTY